MTTILSARDRVIELLRTLDEARVTYDSRNRGGGASMMPTLYNEGSYRELEDCLALMRDGGEHVLVDPSSGRRTFGPTGFEVQVMRPAQRRFWWHVCTRHRWGDQRVLLVTVERNRLGPRFLMPGYSELIAGGPVSGSNKARVRAYCWSEFVDEALVEEGIRELVRLMHGGRHDRITLPRLLLRRKLGLPIEDDIVEDEVWEVA